MGDCGCTEPSPSVNGTLPCLSEMPNMKATNIAAYTVLMVLSLTGNTLVIAIFYRNPQMRTPLNFLIVNMAVSDLLIPVFVLPRRVIGIDINDKWLIEGPLGELLCKLVNFVEDVATDVSILTMVIIGLERFYCVLFPLREPLSTNRVRLWTVAAIWIIAGASRAYYFYFCQLVFYREYDLYTCDFVAGSDCETFYALKVQWAVFFVCFTVVPFILLVIFYSSVAVSLYRQRSCHVMASRAAKQRANENRRVTWMMATTVVLFLSAWTPFNVSAILMFFAPCHLRSSCSFLSLISFEFIPFTHTALNPLVYFIFSQNYRNGLRQIFWRCRNCISRTSVNDNVHDCKQNRNATNADMELLKTKVCTAYMLK